MVRGSFLPGGGQCSVSSVSTGTNEVTAHPKPSVVLCVHAVEDAEMAKRREHTLKLVKRSRQRYRQQ